MDEESFKEAIRHAKIPILVLDQKWHRLFAISGKPDEVKQLEVELNELLQLQGRLNNEQRELKKLKNQTKVMLGFFCLVESQNSGCSSQLYSLTVIITAPCLP